MLCKSYAEKVKVGEIVVKENRMSSLIADGLLLTGSYTLIAAVVVLQRWGLLVTFAYYPMLCMTVIMAISITTSMFSRQMSLDVTSAIFTVVWVPLSVVLKSPGNPTNHLMDTVQYQTPDSRMSIWLRQCVFTFMVYRCVEEVPHFGWITWVAGFNLALYLLGLLSRQFSPGGRFQGTDVNSLPPSPPVIFLECLTFLGFILYSLMSTSRLTLAASTWFCFMTSTVTRNVLVKDLGNIATDTFDGLEKEYIEALILFTDIFAHLFLLVTGLVSWDIFVIVLPCASVYYPFCDVRARVWRRIQSERAALTPFPRAGITKLLRHDDVCPVCLCPMKAARVTPCGHMFHSRCLRLCLQEKPVCPLCIQSLVPPS